MDPRRFDSLTRSLAAAKTRRGFLGGLAALGAGLLGSRTAGAQVTQAQCGNVVCASNPGVCRPGCVCCVYANGNSRCRPPQDCTAPGTVVSPTTTTTTTTAAPTTTSTTTTTQAPAQGTCPTGSDACAAGAQGPADTACNGSVSCSCYRTVAGETVCGFDVSPGCLDCTSDEFCQELYGKPEVFCVNFTGSQCGGCGTVGDSGNTCVERCPYSP